LQAPKEPENRDFCGLLTAKIYHLNRLLGYGAGSFRSIILYHVSLLQKPVTFATGFQAKACGLKSGETCIFKSLLLQNFLFAIASH
jgi:hypothetical protein